MESFILSPLVGSSFKFSAASDKSNDLSVPQEIILKTKNKKDYLFHISNLKINNYRYYKYIYLHWASLIQPALFNPQGGNAARVDGRSGVI